jgi:cell wall-associated NlpC family hydrolase
MQTAQTQPDLSLAESFAQVARQWAADKVPYRHRGTTRTGCDCTGLLIGVAQELGFLAGYVLRDYPPDWNLHSGAGLHVIEELERFGDPISKSEAGPGDVAVMYFGRCPAHCGIIVAPHLMVHCWRDGLYCRYGMLRNSPWSRRWSASYRFDGEKLG